MSSINDKTSCAICEQPCGSPRTRIYLSFTLYTSRLLKVNSLYTPNNNDPNSFRISLHQCSAEAREKFTAALNPKVKDATVAAIEKFIETYLIALH